jgi:DNA-binding transcriptional LysR family regulator
MHYNIRYLQTFECVYRHNSLALAAKELKVTPSAISHQLKSLRDQIGEDLVQKSGRSIKFTTAGQKLGKSLTYAFSEIDASVRDTIGCASRPLRIMVGSAFGQGWLIRRLQSTAGQRWRHGLQVKMFIDPTPEITDSVADIFFSTIPLKSGYWSAKLFDEVLVAVVTPKAHVDKCAQKTSFITHEIHESCFADDWSKFFASAPDLADHALEDAMVIGASHYILGLEMALSGVGVALIPYFLAETALNDGRLTLWSDHHMHSGHAYYINIKYARRNEPAIEEFYVWFREAIKVPQIGYGERRNLHAVSRELQRDLGVT